LWKYIWNIDGFSKINTFYWTLAHRKILTRENFKKEGIVGPSKCVMCTEAEESTFYLFIEIPRNFGENPLLDWTTRLSVVLECRLAP
jgi:hypothetical protein